MPRVARHHRLAALAATVLITACSPSITGAPQRSAGGPAPGAPDPALLNPGNYPRRPQPPMGTAPTALAGSLLDSQRMADFVTGPWEVDPSLIDAHPIGFSGGAMPLKDADALTSISVPEVAQAAAGHNYINGYLTARKNGSHTTLFNIVLRFATPADAAAAATAMSQATLHHPDKLLVNSNLVMNPQAIPAHPDTAAVSRTTQTGGTTWWTIDAFTPHGSNVLMQRAQVTTALTDDITLITKTLAQQGPSIDGFQPTDPSEFTTLPRDPTGLLARALPRPTDQTSVNDNATFGAHGELNYQLNPLTSAKLFAATGVDAVVHADDTLTRAHDAAGAATVAQAAAQEIHAVSTPAAPVPNMPNTTCARLNINRFYWCAGTADRYEFELTAPQLAAAHQKMAAQYLMLTTK